MRTLWIGLCVVMLTAGCASASKTGTPASTSPSASVTTIDPNLTPNSIPYIVGAKIGLPNDWIVAVTKVHRPYSQAGLPAVAADRQYVAVDITMAYQGRETETVNAANLFVMADGDRTLHKVVKAPTANGIDGSYKFGTTHSGRLVYAVPPKVRLGLAMDGVKIGTQRSVFTIDPPTVPAD